MRRFVCFAVAALCDTGSPLTEREREVLAATARSKSVAEIAGTLYLSESTVRDYLFEAIQKRRGRTRGEAVRIAKQQGWL